jgi:membrane protease YdiL (CAAX protease family)
MMEKERGLETRRIWLFLIITFVMTYAWTIGLIWPRVLGRDVTTLTQEETLVNTALTAVLMFFPALGVLITRIVTREGFNNSMLRLNLRGNVRYYLIGWFGPMVLTVLGAVLYYAIYPSEFTLATLKTTMAAQPMPTAALVVVMLFSPWFNLIPSLGEEWGWRGYLLPKVARRMGFLPTILLTGLIWGLWHAPIIVTGHNYGVGYPGYPWVGIVAMCLFCVVLGTLLSYITLKTKSCWPAVFAHGMMNGTASIGVIFLADPMAYDRFIGPVPTGILGAAFYLLAALWIVWQMRKR